MAKMIDKERPRMSVSSAEIFLGRRTLPKSVSFSANGASVKDGRSLLSETAISGVASKDLSHGIGNVSIIELFPRLHGVVKSLDIQTPQREEKTGLTQKVDASIRGIRRRWQDRKKASGNAGDVSASADESQRTSAGGDGRGGGSRTGFAEADGGDRWREKTPDRYYAEVPFREFGDIRYMSYEEQSPEDLARAAKALSHLLTADLEKLRPQTISFIKAYWQYSAEEKGRATDAANLRRSRVTEEEDRIKGLFNQSDMPSRITAYDYLQAMQLIGRGAFPQDPDISRDQKLIVWEGLLKQLGVLDNDLAGEHIDPGATVFDARKALNEFPPGEIYKKQGFDWLHLNKIEEKMGQSEELDAADLAFLYEVDSPILGFNNRRDERIATLRFHRNAQEDMPVALGCDSSQIARTPEEINANTKAYVGALAPGIFTTLQEHNIKHVYTDFPEGKIVQEIFQLMILMRIPLFII